MGLIKAALSSVSSGFGDQFKEFVECPQVENDVIIPSGEIRMIPTGIAIELPHNTEAQVRSRSGLAIKSGIAVVNGIGTIDEDYRGEICVGLINHSKVDFKISRASSSYAGAITPSETSL